MGTAHGAAVGTSTATVLVGAAGPIAPGEVVSAAFRFDPTESTNEYFSWMTMILPSNDGFVGNDDPMGHRVFNGGAFSGADFVVAGTDALDAGTEDNDEDELNMPFFGAATTPGAGTMTASNIAAHAGFLVAGPILSDGMFAGADFANVAGYEFLRVSVSSSTPTSTASGISSLRISGTTATLESTVINLSGAATAVELRNAAAGAVGPVLEDVTGDIDVNENGVMRITTTFTVDQAFITAVESDLVYISVQTALNPTGEVRGQIVPPVANL